MLVVKNITVWTLDRDSLTVSWDYEQTAEDLTSYTIAILRSGAEAGGYSQVSQEMIAGDTSTFEDSGVNLHSKWREYFYRIRVTQAGTGATQEYGSRPVKEVMEGKDPGGVVMEAMPDLDALESIRRFDVVAKEYAGRRVLVLSERTLGTRCSNCWDHVKRRKKFSDCKTCYGTGVIGGYYRPQECYAVKPPTQERSQPTALFEMQVNDVVMWFSSKPRIKPRDLVVDSDGRRWRAVAVRKSEKLWALTRQTVLLREITKDQVEFDIAITGWDVDSFTASPARQFIRATDIDSYKYAAASKGIDDA